MTTQDDALRRLLEAQDSKFYGKYRGQVVSNDDPLRKGRLEVRVPSVLGDASLWALPCVPYAGNGVGFYAMPEPGSGVWVEFEEGDPSFPIWTGCFWAREQIDAIDATPNIKFWKTKRFTLRIDDELGEIVLKNDTGSELRLTAIELEQKSGSVLARASGGRKTELSARGFSVHDGAFEVV